MAHLGVALLLLRELLLEASLAGPAEGVFGEGACLYIPGYRDHLKGLSVLALGAWRCFFYRYPTGS